MRCTLNLQTKGKKTCLCFLVDSPRVICNARAFIGFFFLNLLLKIIFLTMGAGLLRMYAAVPVTSGEKYGFSFLYISENLNKAAILYLLPASFLSFFRCSSKLFLHKQFVPSELVGRVWRHFQINMEPRYATMTVDWSAMHCLRHRHRGRDLPSQGWTRSLQMDLTRPFSERTRTVQRTSRPGLDIPCMSSACHCAHREVLRNRLNCVGREKSAFGGALHLETQVSPLKNEMQSRAQTRAPFRSCSVAL